MMRVRHATVSVYVLILSVAASILSTTQARPNFASGQLLAVTGDAAAYTAAIPGTPLPYAPGTANPGTSETVNTWNQRGNLLTTRRMADASATGLITESFTRDPTGHRTAVTDGMGHRTRFLYDGFGRVVRTIHNDSTPTLASQNQKL